MPNNQSDKSTEEHSNKSPIERLKIKDKPGAISVMQMRAHFECTIEQTPVFKALSLEAVEFKGEFSHYADTHTDEFWKGFAIGMRCAERIQQFQANRAISPPVTHKEIDEFFGDEDDQ
jgi:hypothetical protein